MADQPSLFDDDDLLDGLDAPDDLTITAPPTPSADAPSLFDAGAPPEADLTVTLPDDRDDPEAVPNDLDGIEGDEARETLFLADAMALAYRAFFSMKNASLTAPDGTDTRTLYGFATALLKLLEDERPEHIAVVFDAIGGQPTFRDQLYDDYKAHRPPMPPEIKSNIPLIKRLVEAFREHVHVAYDAQ